MALIKALPTDFGIPATYWIPTALPISRLEDAVDVVMMGWPSKAHRDAGAKPLATRRFVMTGVRDKFAGGINFTDVYNTCRDRLPEFADAEDDVKYQHSAPTEPIRVAFKENAREQLMTLREGQIQRFLTFRIDRHGKAAGQQWIDITQQHAKSLIDGLQKLTDKELAEISVGDSNWPQVIA